MKKNGWLILSAMLATSVMAQDNTNTPGALPEIPAPATSPATETAPAPTAMDTNAPAVAPAPKPKKKHVVHHKIKEPTVTLQPGPAEVAASVNVRGQAGLKGEAIAHLSKGDTVNVLEEINLGKHAIDEPAQWAKISYPTNAHIWVFAKYIDPNGAVTTKKLNLRAGPGENYSVVGVLEQGATVNQIQTKGNWMEVEPPTNAYAFVAAMYLKQEAPVVAQTTPTPPAETEPTPTPVPEAPAIQPQPNQPAPEVSQTPAPPEVPEPTYNPNIPRIVSHEGVVRHVGSPIAPTAYELYDPATDENIDFLYSTTTNLDLSRYSGMRIDVTGEEDLAARWQTPVLTIQQIIVIETNAIPNRVYYSPRQQQERGRH